MEWAAIIALVVDMISKCMENRETEAIKSGLLCPGDRERRALRRVLRRQPHRLRRKELARTVDEGMDKLRSATYDEITEIVESAVRIRAKQGG